MGTAAKMKYIILLLIIFNVALSARWIINGNLFFHTDIARDFLLMEDIVNNKHFTLIGPRSGAIPGLFHGPLWLYLNLPAFVIGGGNPVFVGWFWVALYILSIVIIYFVAKKMFGEEEGRLSALLLSSVTILQVRSLFNPYGALILSPLYFYLFYRYLQSKQIKPLIASLFILGLIIQFQMAFGVPILFLTFFYLVYYLYRNKRLTHLVSFFILLIPFSSYILFELRNNFLQIRSILDYLFGSQNHGKLDINFMQLILLRAKEFVTDGLGSITQGNIYLSIPLVLFLIPGIYKAFRKQKLDLFHFLSILFYGGFWFFTIFFKGPVWGYYFMPFIPLLVLLFVSLRQTSNKIIFYSIFIVIYLFNLQIGIKDMLSYNPDPYKQDVSTWKFNALVAKEVFSGSEKSFGYFIFTPDLYGYSPRYAVDFYQRKDINKKVYPYQKELMTYLVIAPPPEYGKDSNSIWYQKNINSTTWRSNDIRINRVPNNIISFPNGFVVEKYNLSKEEIEIKPNPFLINGIFFR